MRGFNLSRWALEHIPLIRYLIGALLIGGILSYSNLGQDEDPPFTFKTMLIQAYWPGATADEVSEQLTERIEKKLQEDMETHPVLRHLTKAWKNQKKDTKEKKITKTV